MRILAISDVESKFIWDHFDPGVFRGVDLIISCGDLKAKYLSFLVSMIPAPLLYVPGNHDKCFVKDPPDGCECIDGRLVVYKGLRIAGFGGCRSCHPTIYEYNDKQMWRRVKKLVPEIRRKRGFDILVTHAPAMGLGDSEGTFHQGFEAFRFLDETFSPGVHLFGHRHLSGSPVESNAVFRFGNTTMVNASGYKFVDVQTQPEKMM